MRVFFDTSVLVAALLRQHPFHERALPWLARARRGELEFVVAAHTLLELYSVLTRMPLRPRISPSTAERLVLENVADGAELVALDGEDYRNVLRRAVQRGTTGGTVYDGLLAEAARKAGVDTLLTLNPRDFRRAWPEAGERIREP